MCLCRIGEVRHARVEEELALLAEPLQAAVLDPPRAGCGPRVIEAVLAKEIARVVVVSCDPATGGIMRFAKD